MDEFFDIPTLIVIGVAIVILFRLRSVLGTKVGFQRPANDEAKRDGAKTPGKADDGVVPIRPLDASNSEEEQRRTRKLAAEVEQFSHGDDDLAKGLHAMIEADPAFGPKSFIDGAKQAYEMILTAFASGDRKTLKNMLEKDVYDGFGKAIEARESANHKVDFTFVGLPKVEMSHAGFDKRDAQITVQFHAEIVSATHDADGKLVEGHPDHVQNIADEWTFARNPKSRDPNWKLVATNQLA